MLSERINAKIAPPRSPFPSDVYDFLEEIKPEVAKLERVARAAKILEADYHCFDNSLPDVWDELEAALADLGALGG